MSHESNQENSEQTRSVISFKNGFWLVIILVFLFIGAINFVQSQSSEEGSSEHKEKSEMKSGAKAEATPAETPAK